MIKISDKNIALFFAAKPFWNASLGASKLMGHISYQDMIKIMVAIENYNPDKDACTHDLGIKYVADINKSTDVFNHPAIDPYTRHKFELIDSSWGFNPAFPKCAHCAKISRADVMASERMFLCAKNLRAGKCQDTFMRNTLGAVLFPQFYAKDKQK